MKIILWHRGGTMRRLLDALYLAAGYAAAVFLILIFSLMMIMSVGRAVRPQHSRRRRVRRLVDGGDGFPRPGAHVQVRRDDPRWPAASTGSAAGTRQVIEIDRAADRACLCRLLRLVCRAFTYYSWLTNDRAQGVVPMPMWIPQLGYSGGLVLLTIAFVDELVHVLARQQAALREGPAQDRRGGN